MIQPWILRLLFGALAMPILMCILFGLGYLLSALDDAEAAAVVVRVNLALAVLWVFDLILLVLAVSFSTVVHTVEAVADDDESSLSRLTTSSNSVVHIAGRTPRLVCDSVPSHIGHWGLVIGHCVAACPSDFSVRTATSCSPSPCARPVQRSIAPSARRRSSSPMANRADSGATSSARYSGSGRSGKRRCDQRIDRSDRHHHWRTLRGRGRRAGALRPGHH